MATHTKPDLSCLKHSVSRDRCLECRAGRPKPTVLAIPYCKECGKILHQEIDGSLVHSDNRVLCDLQEVRITSADIRHANKIIKEKGYNLNWPTVREADKKNLKMLNKKMTVWEESYYKAGLRDGDGVGFIKGFIIGIAVMLFLMVTKIISIN